MDCLLAGLVGETSEWMDKFPGLGFVLFACISSCFVEESSSFLCPFSKSLGLVLVFFFFFSRISEQDLVCSEIFRSIFSSDKVGSLHVLNDVWSRRGFNSMVQGTGWRRLGFFGIHKVRRKIWKILRIRVECWYKKLMVDKVWMKKLSNLSEVRSWSTIICGSLSLSEISLRIAC